MDNQVNAVFPLPILEYIVSLSGDREKLVFKETCKLLRDFVNKNIFPILATTLVSCTGTSNPTWGCLDFSSATLYFTESRNHTIRSVDLNTNEVKIICGTMEAKDYYIDYIPFHNPEGIAMNEEEKVLYVSDCLNHLIRRVRLIDGRADTLCGTEGKFGRDDGTGNQATFRYPQGLSFDSISQYLYVADSGNNSIRRISVKDGSVDTVCGSGKSGYLDGILQESMFDCPTDVEWNAAEEALYVSDFNNHVIRVVSMKERRVRTLCGTPQASGHEDGSYIQAKFNSPNGLALDLHSNYLYVTDFANDAVRRISLSGEGIVSTVCGSSEQEGTRDGLRSLFFHPEGIVVDPYSYSLYVVDSGNDSIRKVIDRTRSLME